MDESLAEKEADDQSTHASFVTADSTGRPPIIIPQGLSFSRAFQELPEDSSYVIQFDGDHCKSHDQNGDNDCHYDWGDVVRGNYSLSFPTPVDLGDMMHGQFKVSTRKRHNFSHNMCKMVCRNHSLRLSHSLVSSFRTQIDRFVPYEFSCPICGDPCVLEIPVIMVNYTIDTPPCPVGPDFSHFVKEPLNQVSPTAGIRTHLAGSVQLQKANGDLIAEFTVEAYVK